MKMYVNMTILLAVFFAGLYLGWGRQDKAGDQIEVRQIKGSPIRINRLSTSGREISFRADAEGKGEAEVSIPKTLIPELKLNELQGTFIYDYYSGRFHKKYGLSYWRRMGRVKAGGGMIISGNSIGFQAGAAYSF